MARKTGPQFVQSVTDMSDPNLHCHVYGHPWNEGPIFEEVPPEFGVLAWVARNDCTSCGKVRTDYMQPETMELLLRTYTEVDGYRVVEPTKFRDYRAESMRRRMARGGRKRHAQQGR
jgi:hypothetical protein